MSDAIIAEKYPNEKYSNEKCQRDRVCINIPYRVWFRIWEIQIHTHLVLHLTQ